MPQAIHISPIDNVVVASDGNYGFGGVENGRAVIKNVRFGDFFLLSENASAENSAQS